MAEVHPFDTENETSEAGKRTYRTIASRLGALNPKINIAEHIARRKLKNGGAEVSTLEAHDVTLDGINFIAKNPKQLASTLESLTDESGNRAFASMKEDPDHWALKMSFKKTVGTGWREAWRPAPYGPPGAVPAEPRMADNMFKMRFGTAGAPVRFTALHCAVHEIGGQCNIHIDENGFVLSLPDGFSLTPNLYDHYMNELLLKTDFRDWLLGKTSNESVKRAIKEVFHRVAFQFPNAANGFAGLDKIVNSIGPPRVPGDVALTALKILAPSAVMVDLYENDYFKVQVTGTFRDERAITITMGGDW